MKGKRIKITISIAAIIFLTIFGIKTAADNEDKTFLSVATASTGGTYYPIGVGMANIWSYELKDKKIQASGQSSAGSIENIELLREGEAHLAILQGLISSQAYAGDDGFAGKPYKDLRTVAMLWPNVEHFVLMDNAIETGNISDIDGTRFSVGPQASGTEQSTVVMMEGLELTKANISPEYLGYNDTVSAMRDGRLDGGSLPAGIPISAITDMFASNVKASILEVTDEQLDKINAVSNTWYPYTIPGGTYPRVEEDIQTIAQPNLLSTTKDIDEETIYTLTKTLYENLDKMYEVHNSAKEITLETALDGVTVPLHAGAYKYFKEVGLEIPEELIPPEAK
ncbi:MULTISPECIES: TAXI family TRAP transporter solute-binding subunit [Cytobacillus]|uniref:TAXI family TRAP transporter solute-binding subunit n=1 Tax=Cytobacillus TaxID=2675230 RepID=UPI001CD7C0D2|nr:TAXI family TRAP transporter solute-binding subunit [Cytobacillus kochii]MCA1024922.1 TAXI family TRAP transporter solute-binding subunit [Cytobacillus kochii]MCM3324017.1 TAXI family TRAP transporter solute-binding subunit [Cytobacillus kochii]MCM3346579.1 TAXI family TRAP transporter solute-binding subunit [Cytobacillus kochii]MDM5206614.1 TAXI family TRAP transporter solute-binding subunit [Cytobacillus kochii]